MKRLSSEPSGAGGFECTSVEGHRGIEYATAVAERIRAEVVDGFRAFSRGGLEVGGVLFGTVERDSARITAHRPLECEHALGPGFVLSPKDEGVLGAILAGAAADPELAGLQPVGWYRSCTRSEPHLSDGDLALHARFFSAPANIVLVLRPETGATVRASFYAVNAGKPLCCSPELRLRPALELIREAPVPVRPVPAPVPEVPNADVPSPRPVEPLIWRFPAIAVALVFVVAALAGTLVRVPAMPPRHAAAPIQLRAIESNGQLWITWDKNSASVLGAEKGMVRVKDGSSSFNVDLNREDLTTGSLTFARHSCRVDVRMLVYPHRQRVEEMVSFLSEPGVCVQPAAK